MIIPTVRLPSYCNAGCGASLPKYQTSGAAAFDLTASRSQDTYWVNFGMVTIIPTGLKMAIPLGYEGQVRARGGLAAKHGIVVVNAPGTVDSDYRGEIMVILTTCKIGAPYEVKPGDRIAQMLIAPFQSVILEDMDFDEFTGLGATARGEGRFGSTGV
jgi:dUTP pyrophosphatase